MKKAPILISIEMKDGKKNFRLNSADEIFINDNKIYQKVFKGKS